MGKSGCVTGSNLCEVTNSNLQCLAFHLCIHSNFLCKHGVVVRVGGYGAAGYSEEVRRRSRSVIVGTIRRPSHKDLIVATRRGGRRQCQGSAVVIVIGLHKVAIGVPVDGVCVQCPLCIERYIRIGYRNLSGCESAIGIGICYLAVSSSGIAEEGVGSAGRDSGADSVRLARDIGAALARLAVRAAVGVVGDGIEFVPLRVERYIRRRTNGDSVFRLYLRASCGCGVPTGKAVAARSSRRGGVGERLAFLHAHIRGVGVCRFAANALGIVRRVGNAVQRHEMEIAVVSTVVRVHTEETRCPCAYAAVELPLVVLLAAEALYLPIAVGPVVDSNTGFVCIERRGLPYVDINPFGVQRFVYRQGIARPYGGSGGALVKRPCLPCLALAHAHAQLITRRLKGNKEVLIAIIAVDTQASIRPFHGMVIPVARAAATGALQIRYRQVLELIALRAGIATATGTYV